jgi:hypothetical protein
LWAPNGKTVLDAAKWDRPSGTGQVGPSKWDRPSGIVSSERAAGAGAFLSLPMQVFDYWNDPWGHTLESVLLVLTPTPSIAPNVSPLSRTCDRTAHQPR